MVKKVFSLFLCLIMAATASLVMAGGPPGPRGACGPPNQACAYWGDAPFPGMCGGVVALPFLVMGSLLGGNTVGPAGCGPAPHPGNYCAPPPQGRYAYAPPPPVRYAPAPPPPRQYAASPGYYPPPQDDSVFSGLGCVGMCTDLLSSVTGGGGLLY